MILGANPKLFSLAAAAAAVAALAAGEEDGWTYKVVPVAGSRVLAHVEAFDENGFYAGTIGEYDD